MPDFRTILDTGAGQLKKTGTFSTEFTASDVDQMMRQVVSQSARDLKKEGVSIEIRRLSVQLADGSGIVRAEVKGTKKIGFLSKSEVVRASFGIENVLADGVPTGRVRTTEFVVKPEVLYAGLVRVKASLDPHVAGERINNSFRNVLVQEMLARGAKVESVSTLITMNDHIKIELKGASR